MIFNIQLLFFSYSLLFSYPKNKNPKNLKMAHILSAVAGTEKSTLNNLSVEKKYAYNMIVFYVNTTILVNAENLNN